MTEMLLYLLHNIIVMDLLIVLLFLWEKRWTYKCGHLWRKLLWIFICIRMIVPMEISLPVVLENQKPIEIAIEVPVKDQRSVSAEEWDKSDDQRKVPVYEPILQQDETAVNTDVPQKAKENFSLHDFWKNHWEIAVLILWFAGFVICLFYHIFQYYLVKDFYLEDAKISRNEKLYSVTKRWCEKYRIKKPPQLLEKEDAMTPMTFGYFKRQMIFPLNIYESDDVELVICHELIHMKYLDSWYKTLVLLVCDLYWFNPIFLLMKRMAFSDVEFVCDERMRKELSEEELQNYGAAIVKTGRNAGGKNVPSMVQFAVRKEELKKRLNNLFEFRSWRNGTVPLSICIVSIVLLISMFSFSVREVFVDVTETGEVSFTIPEHDMTIETFYTDDLEAINEQKDVESSYITERFNAINHYYIDKEGVLWGTGSNACWQLGIEKDTDLNNYDAVYDIPVKIAENVIHVDANINGEFVIYLTEDGKLYGLGENAAGVLQMPITASPDYLYPGESCTAEPKLLMSEVIFASAGQESVSVLTKDGNVWWWGRIGATTGTLELSQIYVNEPRLMLENVRYTVCGPTAAAAIDENNRLWLWGCNVFGQCGRDGADYLLEPYMACEEVEMVWPEFLSTRQNVFDTEAWSMLNPYTAPEDCCIQNYVTFVRKTDGKMYACGMDIGHVVKTVKYFGDLFIEDSEHSEIYTRSYSPHFLKITVEEMQGKMIVEQGEDL